jgi:L-ascorbate metabolism protein UlaG (beta-lactamase superfamily)
MKAPLRKKRLPVLGAAASFARTTRHWGPRLYRTLMHEVATQMEQPRFRPKPAHWSASSITAAWLGHSSVLINFYGMTVVTDPVLAPRIGVTFGKRTIGPKRLTAPAMTVNELPPIDLVLLSHAHMDHLHVATLNMFPATTQAITAKNTADLLTGTKMKDVRELHWGERATIRTHHGELAIEAFQVAHWGARWRHDKHRGFNGYILERNGKRILFGGDTAYCEHFKKLKSKGPFDFAIMPIGSYNAHNACDHCTPEEAVQMANDAGAHHFLPIHHMTFNFGEAVYSEPMQRLQKALDTKRIAWREVGETFTL